MPLATTGTASVIWGRAPRSGSSVTVWSSGVPVSTTRCSADPTTVVLVPIWRRPPAAGRASTARRALVAPTASLHAIAATRPSVSASIRPRSASSSRREPCWRRRITIVATTLIVASSSPAATKVQVGVPSSAAGARTAGAGATTTSPPSSAGSGSSAASGSSVTTSGAKAPGSKPSASMVVMNSARPSGKVRKSSLRSSPTNSTPRRSLESEAPVPREISELIAAM